jgi:hypothetical protein
MILEALPHVEIICWGSSVGDYAAREVHTVVCEELAKEEPSLSAAYTAATKVFTSKYDPKVHNRLCYLSTGTVLAEVAKKEAVRAIKASQHSQALAVAAAEEVARSKARLVVTTTTAAHAVAMSTMAEAATRVATAVCLAAKSLSDTADHARILVLKAQQAALEEAVNESRKVFGAACAIEGSVFAAKAIGIAKFDGLSYLEVKTRRCSPGPWASHQHLAAQDRTVRVPLTSKLDDVHSELKKGLQERNLQGVLSQLPAMPSFSRWNFTQDTQQMMADHVKGIANLGGSSTLREVQPVTKVVRIIFVNARDAVQHLVEHMHANTAVVRAQEQGCRALLAHLCNGDAGSRTKVAAEGGIEAIVQAMTKHDASVAVQEHGCRALLYLCRQRRCDDAEIRMKVVAAGGIEAVVQAMTKHTLSVSRRSTDAGRCSTSSTWGYRRRWPQQAASRSSCRR